MIRAILFDFGDTLAMERGEFDRSMADQEFEKAPYVESVLRGLRRRFRLAVVSNTSTWREREIRNALRRMGLERYFDAVVTSVDVGSPKPKAEIFQEALRRLGVEAHECMMVGDRTDADILGGNRLGMETVHIDWQPHQEETIDPELQKPDHTIRSLKELLELIGPDG
ncbi:MAG: HAD family hydrolase [Candidatus Geothermarchaeales archaeon]